MSSKIFFTSLLALLVVFLLSFQTYAKGPLKIAVVNLQKVLEQSQPGQEASSKLKKEFKQLKKRLNKERRRIEKMKEDLQKQQFMLSQEARIDKETEYKKMVQNYQLMLQSYKYKMQLEEKRLREPIVKVIIKVLENYRRQNNYDLILDKNVGVVTSSEKIDITKDIIKRVDQEWKKLYKKGKKK